MLRLRLQSSLLRSISLLPQLRFVYLYRLCLLCLCLVGLGVNSLCRHPSRCRCWCLSGSLCRCRCLCRCLPRNALSLLMTSITIHPITTTIHMRCDISIVRSCSSSVTIVELIHIPVKVRIDHLVVDFYQILVK